MTSDPRSALPPEFDGFGAEVFERQAPPRVEEPWRTHPPLRGLRPDDRVVVGRQVYEVIRPFSDYEVMARKPGAKRKAFNVWQNGPTVEVREQRGSSETTMAGPVIASAPFDAVRVARAADDNRARVTLSTSASEWPGLSRGRSLASFDQRQLRRGAEVEREHVGGVASIARRIAADHLVEDPRYYEKLARMEVEGNRATAKGSLTRDQRAILTEIARAGEEGLVLDKGIVAAGSLVRKGLATRVDLEQVPATRLYTERSLTHTLRGKLRTVTLSRYALTEEGRAVIEKTTSNRAGADAFGRNEAVIRYEHSPAFAEAVGSGDVEDATEQAIGDVRLSPGPRAVLFARASAKGRPDEADAEVVRSLEAAPLPLGYVSSVLLYSSAIDRLPARTKARLYRLVKGGHVRVARTWRPAPQYWLVAK